MHAWYTTGMELLGKGSPAAAAQVLQRAANAEPASRSVREALARAQFDTGQYEAAAANFRAIVEATPTDDYANFGLGLALARSGDHESAAEYLALAAAMRPDRKHYTDALTRSAPPSSPASGNPRGPDRYCGAMPDALAAAYDVLLLDLDGVVYIGGTPIPGAPEALQRASEQGAQLAYVTNNASRTPAAVAAMLTGMGAPATADRRRHVRPGRRPPAGREAAAEVEGPRARRPGAAPRGPGARPDPGLHRGRQARRRSSRATAPASATAAFAEGGLAVRAGALFVGTNADSTIPSARGTAPGNGSLLQVIEHATGVEPHIAGKPEPPLHRESVIRTGAKHPLVIGDRLDTDIEAAYNADADSLLVLTGRRQPPQRRAGPAAPPPDLHRRDPRRPARSPIRPSPAPTTAPPAQAGPRPRPRPGTAPLTLTGDGPAIDGLRALAAAAWAVHDRHGALDADQVAAALDQLAAHGLKSR